MIYTFLMKLINMSLTAGVVIICVLLLRFCFRKAPKIISYSLWSVVLFRLLCPETVSSNISLFNWLDMPAWEVALVEDNIDQKPEMIVNMDQTKNSVPLSDVAASFNETTLQEHSMVKHIETVTFGVGSEEKVQEDSKVILGIGVWVVGFLAMGIYALYSYIQLKHRLVTVYYLRENIYLTDDIHSPFVLGLIRPKIYLPSNITEKELDYILLHERHHINRGDHIVKVISYVALSIHWFNPLVWVAFVQASKDMEMSCDEAVIKKMGTEVLADYSASLLNFAAGRHIMTGMPLAFGEVDTKARILNLAKWKKPIIGLSIIVLMVCVLVSVTLLTDPKVDVNALVPGTIYVQDENIYMNPLSSYIGTDGTRYEIHEKCFEILGVNHESEKIKVNRWEWREFPYTDEEWFELFVFTKPPIDVMQTCNTVLYQKLDDRRFLLLLDDELWIVSLLPGDDKMREQVWSIHRLVMEECVDNSLAVNDVAVSKTPEYDFTQGDDTTKGDIVEKPSPEVTGEPIQEKPFSYADLTELEFWFCSGAGGWSTIMYVNEDGSFYGSYRDGNVGECYACDFSGQFAEPVKINEYTWSAEVVSIKQDRVTGERENIDGIQYIYTTPYGLEEAKEVLFYLPGAQSNELPKEFISWANGPRWEENRVEDILNCYGIYNVEEKLGFSSFPKDYFKQDVIESLILYPETYTALSLRNWDMGYGDEFGSVYERVIISNVTSEGFDFSILRKDYDTEEEEVLIPLTTAMYGTDGVSAIATINDDTLVFDFSINTNSLPVVVFFTIDGYEEVEGVTFGCSWIPGFEYE